MKKKNMFLAVTAVTILGVSALLSGCAEGMIDPAMALKAQRVQASVQAGNAEEANAPAAEDMAADAAVDAAGDASSDAAGRQ